IKEDDREKFLCWYKKQLSDNVVFNMADEIEKYCIGDVDILRRACIMFRGCFLNANNVDPLQEASRIAGACSLVFRRRYLQPNCIGIPPKSGYRLIDNQSRIALKWLFWLEFSLNIDIDHAGKGREVKLKEGLRVDGYNEET